MPSCGAETHLFSSHPTIDASEASASRAWGPCRPVSPKDPIKANHATRNRPEECLGSTMACGDVGGRVTGFDARETGSLASSTDHDTENKRNITTDFENVRKQIIGFKKMRDDDLITEDEFEAKKKQLLGLASSF